ncbi:MAG: aminotransferase class I/II-fold pyridoxal phosphate-dependent enzyme [Gammaproteobacteria bacterium]|nr:aminotransferase class I/II-fold pyridoxal phosphate-dependent enzyme [Gammaproteobacteria bacterium]
MALPDSKLPGVGTTIFTVMSRLASETGAINLGQGFPDFQPPARLCELIAEHLAAGHNQYAPMPGLPALCDAIAIQTQRRQGLSIDAANEITVTAGGTEALFAAIHAIVRPGDEVVMLDPAYDSYGPAAELAGARVHRVPLRTPDFGIDYEPLAAAIGPRTRLLIVNTPHNPTGAVLAASDWERIAHLIEPTGAMVLSDEVYETLVFDGRRHTSVLSNKRLRGRCFAVFSFGKVYNATGWKIGYCVAAPALTAEFRKVHQFLTFSVSTPVQHAIADFMREEPAFQDGLAAFYQARRDRFSGLLAGSRFRLMATAGTYFQLADYGLISQLPDVEFCKELTRSHGVAAIPLSPFCAQPMPARLIRFCFAKDDATLGQAALRLTKV